MSGGRTAVLFAILLAGSGVACTAIVLGKLGNSTDYGLGEAGASSTSSSSSSSGSSNGVITDECSLLGGSFENDKPAHKNRCATCIQNECGGEVEYACARDAGQKFGWFRKMKDCAQSPWIDYPEPDAGRGGGEWRCSEYDKDAQPPFPDNGSPQEHERESERCVHFRCMSGAEPACKLCEITVDKPGSAPGIAYLRDDPCGSCIQDNCSEDIIACCASEPVSQYLQFCALTNEQDYREKCAKIGDTSNVGDGGNPELKLPTAGWGPSDRVCAVRLSQCIESKCSQIAECKSP